MRSNYNGKWIDLTKYAMVIIMHLYPIVVWILWALGIEVSNDNKISSILFGIIIVISWSIYLAERRNNKNLTKEIRRLTTQ